MIKTEFVSLHLYAKGNEQECKTIFTNDDELAYLLMERGKSSRTFNIFVEKLMILPEFIRLIYAKNALGYGFVEEGMFDVKTTYAYCAFWTKKLIIVRLQDRYVVLFADVNSFQRVNAPIRSCCAKQKRSE